MKTVGHLKALFNYKGQSVDIAPNLMCLNVYLLSKFTIISIVHLKKQLNLPRILKVLTIQGAKINPHVLVGTLWFFALGKVRVIAFDGFINSDKWRYDFP